MKQYKDLIYTKKDGAGTVTLNRPEQMNALTRNMMAELAEVMESVKTDREVKIVVIRGAGRTFCSGANLGEVLTTIKDRSLLIEIGRMFGKGIGSIHNCGKPTVAAIHGYCTAGGWEIMCNCDFAIATEDAKMGDFHMNRSLMPGAGATPLLVRILGIRKAKEIILSGKLMSGKEAHEIGLLNRVAPAGKLDETLNEFLSLFTDKTVVGLTHAKFAADRALDTDLGTAFALEALIAASLISSHHAQEGIDAFLNKRDIKWPPDIDWALTYGRD